MALSTQEIMQVALELAGLTEIPPDSGVIVPGEKITKLAVGIDMETAELLLARELKCDGVLSHHPVAGSPKLELHQVMNSQIDRMVAAGVPINKAQKALQKRKEEVERGTHVTNYDRVTSAAKALNMPFLNIHWPADLVTERVVQKHLDEQLNGNPKATCKDVVDALLELPEYQKAATRPQIRVGSEQTYAGKVWVAMAGGTSGGPDVFKAYFEAGVGTLIVMHCPEDALKAVREQNIGNVIVAGHMASDSIGINRLCAALEARGLEIVRLAGVIY
ncbi:hypothetical protein [Carboxydocella sp. ULO1]|uniref:hypothetical protein n=1 Tax=Carboxydocella sp. ULO1 TaxID=1926599 RepID=UPI0009D13D99|nr:hypothetical protein [Carboxydocella sp. ULO1]GAW28489.1 hypothetical protein ULO1_10590 [Carboxydocella sp. ULO1]